MSLPSDYATEEWNQFTTVTAPRPSLLKSHSTPDLSRSTGQATASREIIRPDSGVFANDGCDGRRQRDSYRSYRDTEPLPSPILITHPAYCPASSSGLSYPSSPQGGFPMMPTRLPLRPSVSFGGETRVSNYSTSSGTLADIEKQKGVQAAVFAESLHDRLAETENKQQPTWRIAISMALFCILGAGCGLSTTTMATALPTIARDLQITSAESFWVVNSFMLASTVAQPLFMRLSYAFGARLLLTLGLVLLTGGSLACATTTSLSALIVGRSLAGCGSGISAISTILVSRLVAPAEAERWTYLSGLSYWAGAALGPVIGGAITPNIGWHCIFYVTGAFSALCVLALPITLPLKSDEGADWRELKNVDYFGWILLTGSLTSIALALSSAGHVYIYSWTSWHTIIPFLLGLSAFAAFVQYSRCRYDPLLPISLLRRADALIACLGTLAHGLIFSIITYGAPIMMRAVYQVGLVESGAMLTSVGGSMVLSYASSSALLGKAGFRAFIWTGLGLSATGCGLLMAPTPSTAILVFIPIGLLIGCGLGMLLPTLSTVVQAAARTDDEAVHALHLHGFFNSLGQEFGLSMAGCVFLNAFKRQTGDSLSLSNYAKDLTKDAVALVELLWSDAPLKTQIRSELPAIYLTSLRWVWGMGCIAAAVALLLSLWYARDVRYRAASRRRRISVQRRWHSA